MIKTILGGGVYAYIKQLTEKNGGVPVMFFGTNIPFTYENWKVRHAILGFELNDDPLEMLSDLIWN